MRRRAAVILGATNASDTQALDFALREVVRKVTLDSERIDAAREVGSALARANSTSPGLSAIGTDGAVATGERWRRVGLRRGARRAALNALR
jgi:hypothetical protein